MKKLGTLVVALVIAFVFTGASIASDMPDNGVKHLYPLKPEVCDKKGKCDPIEIADKDQVVFDWPVSNGTGTLWCWMVWWCEPGGGHDNDPVDVSSPPAAFAALGLPLIIMGASLKRRRR